VSLKHRNEKIKKLAEGVAVIPCNWLLHVAKEGESFKK